MLQKFCDSNDYIKLNGGQGTSVKSGNMVLKPIGNEELTTQNLRLTREG